LDRVAVMIATEAMIFPGVSVGQQARFCFAVVKRTAPPEGFTMPRKLHAIRFQNSATQPDPLKIMTG